MISEYVTIDSAINLLNDLLKLDELAIRALVEQRVPCNVALADHATVQVQARAGATVVGLLGVLNGLFDADERGYGPISAVFEDDGHISAFVRTTHHQ